MGHSIDAVIFDMDGLLLDTERMALDAYLEAASEQRIAATRELFTHFIGMDWRRTQAMMEEVFGSQDALRMESAWTRAFDTRVRLDGIPTKPGVEDLLHLVERHGTRIALATSTFRERALMQLDSAGLRDRFGTIVTGDEVSRGKPNPDIFLLAAQRLDVAPSACVALEDSEAGVLAASEAGMDVIMIPDLKQPTEQIRALTTVVCLNLIEAQTVLETILTS